MFGPTKWLWTAHIWCYCSHTNMEYAHTLCECTGRKWFRTINSMKNAIYSNALRLCAFHTRCSLISCTGIFPHLLFRFHFCVILRVPPHLLSSLPNSKPNENYKICSNDWIAKCEARPSHIFPFVNGFYFRRNCHFSRFHQQPKGILLMGIKCKTFNTNKQLKLSRGKIRRFLIFTTLFTQWQTFNSIQCNIVCNS